MMKDIVRIISADYGNILNHILFGFNVIEKKPVVKRLNRQAYVLTPISSLLAKSGYKVYTHILGVSLPRLPESMLGKIEKCIPWCSTKCNFKYRQRCREKETKTEIDAFVFNDEKEACVIEHASEIGSLCWDMVKVYKFLTSQKDFSSCLFLTWLDMQNEEHAKILDATRNLGKMLFDELIGKKNWSTLYITYKIEEGNLVFGGLYTKK